MSTDSDLIDLREESRDRSGMESLVVTRPEAAPERLPPMEFNPTFWGGDGNLLMGKRPAADERPVAPVLYDFAARTFEVFAEAGAAAQWLPSGSHVLVSIDGGTKLQVIDRATKTAHDLFSVVPPTTFTFDFGGDNRSIYYVVSEPQADIYRITVP